MRRALDAATLDATHVSRALRDEAQALDKQAGRLRELARALDERRVIASLGEALSASEEKIDLLRAGLLVARLDNDEVDVDAYCQQLEAMARELAARLDAGAEPAARLAALRKYLFEENGFHGSRGDYYNRANSYLNEVLDDREGLPITLSIVYMELGRRIGLNLIGIGLPGHFVVGHVQGDNPPELIDVFDGATSVARDEAARRVKDAADRELTNADLAPMTKRAIVLRMLTNLLGISGNDTPAAHRYLNAMLALDPQQAQFRWLRAIVRYRLGQPHASLEDVDWLLEHEPEGVDLHRVMELRETLGQQ